MRLTKRDYNILRFLAAQGLATADQLTERYFVSRSSCIKRLHYLITNGLIESLRLSNLRKNFGSSMEEVSSALSLNSEEIWKHRIYRLVDKLRKRRGGAEALSELKMWKHQLQLNGIRRIFEFLYPGAEILTDPDLRTEFRRLKVGSDPPIADLVIRDSAGEIAIEVERNMKSESVYFAKFLDYESSWYRKVIYFCETEQVFNKVAELSKRFEKIGVSRILSPEHVYRLDSGFQSLDVFLDRKVEVLA